MAHFAKIDENNIVTQVIVVHNNELLNGSEESEEKGIDFCESLFGHRNWVQTSYNGTIRHNFANIGFTWDPDNNAFYAPKPYPSWSLDENFIWQPPVQYPNDGERHTWDEDNKTWVKVE